MRVRTKVVMQKRTYTTSMGVSGGEAAMLKTSQPNMAAVRRLWKVHRGIRMCFRHGERRGGAIEVFDEDGGGEECVGRGEMGSRRPNYRWYCFRYLSF